MRDRLITQYISGGRRLQRLVMRAYHWIKYSRLAFASVHQSGAGSTLGFQNPTNSGLPQLNLKYQYSLIVHPAGQSPPAARNR